MIDRHVLWSLNFILKVLKRESNFSDSQLSLKNVKPNSTRIVRYCLPISKAQYEVRLNGKIKFHTRKSMKKKTNIHVSLLGVIIFNLTAVQVLQKETLIIKHHSVFSASWYNNKTMNTTKCSLILACPRSCVSNFLGNEPFYFLWLCMYSPLNVYYSSFKQGSKKKITQDVWENFACAWKARSTIFHHGLIEIQITFCASGK